MQDTAVAVIFEKGSDDVLLVKRVDQPVWVLPGGGIDDGETPEEATLREVLEETGLHCSIVRKIAKYTPVNRLSRIVHLFECQVVDGEQRLTDETSDIGYYSFEAVPGHLFGLHKIWIEDALKRLPEVIVVPNKGTSYPSAIWYLLKNPAVSLQFICNWDFWKRFLPW